MIMVQKFHSIHEIDSEFIPNIEILLQEEIASYNILVQRHDEAPKNCLFTYFLFFGPTQNTPIGFAQLCLKKIPSEELLPWFKKLTFWNKEHEHWKQLTWQIGDGSSGICIFDSKYARTGKEKVAELIKEYESRADIMAQELFSVKGLQDLSLHWNCETSWTKESYSLEPLPKAFKSYREYLGSLDSEIRDYIKGSWRKLHEDGGIKLGDYSNPQEIPQTPTIPPEQLKVWAIWGAQVLTFEKENKLLGCLIVLKGKNGNIFFEPFPFEPEGEALVHDEVYTQYALFKFFDMPEARKCHLMKFGGKIIFDEKEDFKFFQSQGFHIRTVLRHYQSRLKNLLRPI